MEVIGTNHQRGVMRGILGSIVSRAVAATIVCAALVAAGQNLAAPTAAKHSRPKSARVSDVSYELADKAGRLAAVRLTVEGHPSVVSARLTPTGRWLTCVGKGSRWTCPTEGFALDRVTEVSVRFG